jgi:serine/threonine protein phosphatase PrpC
MSPWKSFGASVRGPGHIATGKPNQDALADFHHVWGDGIVISDGLGSKPFSNFGSEAACRAVAYAANACRDMTEIDNDFLSNQIKTNWLSLIAPREPCDCAATCVFAFRLRDGMIRLGMLGDGLAAAVKTDGSVVSLSEDKSHGFSNITAALSPNVAAKDWRHLSLPEDECAAVLLCTDGVSDDLDNVDGFVKGFIEAHRALAAVSANRHIREMLENWPTPKHSDDKTIACLFRKDVTDK